MNLEEARKLADKALANAAAIDEADPSLRAAVYEPLGACLRDIADLAPTIFLLADEVERNQKSAENILAALMETHEVQPGSSLARKLMEIGALAGQIAYPDTVRTVRYEHPGGE